MKIIISGSSGFIGLALVEGLGWRGEMVVPLTRSEKPTGDVVWDPSHGRLDRSVLEGVDHAEDAAE